MDKLQTAPERAGTRPYQAVVLVGSLDRRIVPTLRLVSRLCDAEARALHVSVDDEETRRLAFDWMHLGLTWLPLRIRKGTPDTFLASVREAVDEEVDMSGDLLVILPEATDERRWHGLLHRHSARRIARAIAGHERVTTVIVPYFVARP